MKSNSALTFEFAAEVVVASFHFKKATKCLICIQLYVSNKHDILTKLKFLEEGKIKVIALPFLTKPMLMY